MSVHDTSGAVLFSASDKCWVFSAKGRKGWDRCLNFVCMNPYQTGNKHNNFAQNIWNTPIFPTQWDKITGLGLTSSSFPKIYLTCVRIV
jgi:hypothetical protein